MSSAQLLNGDTRIKSGYYGMALYGRPQGFQQWIAFRKVPACRRVDVGLKEAQPTGDAVLGTRTEGRNVPLISLSSHDLVVQRSIPKTPYW